MYVVHAALHCTDGQGMYVWTSFTLRTKPYDHPLVDHIITPLKCASNCITTLNCCYTCFVLSFPQQYHIFSLTREGGVGREEMQERVTKVSTLNYALCYAGYMLNSLLFGAMC